MSNEQITILKKLLEEGKKLRETNLSHDTWGFEYIHGQEYHTWRSTCKAFLEVHYSDSDLTKEFKENSKDLGYGLSCYEAMIGILEAFISMAKYKQTPTKQIQTNEDKQQNKAETYSGINVGGQGNTIILGGHGHSQTVTQTHSQTTTFDKMRENVDKELSGEDKEEMMKLIQELEDSKDDKQSFMSKLFNFSMKVGEYGLKMAPLIQSLQETFLQ